MPRHALAALLLMACAPLWAQRSPSFPPDTTAPRSHAQSPAAQPAVQQEQRPAPQINTRPARRGKPSPVPAPAPPVAADPLRPSQMPPSPPRVLYRNGMLSIVAENSTLADILNGVRVQTGATIEAPPSAAAERVVVRLGPAPPRDVVAALLNGSAFDYVIVGAEANPSAVQRVIITPRQAQGATTAGPVPAPALQRSPLPGVNSAPDEEAETTEPAEETPQPQQPQVQPQPMPGFQAQPTGVQPGAAQPIVQPGVQPGVQAAPDGTAQPNSPPAVKTPEQLLEELKRMQQQQQNQQQQQRPPQ